MPLTTIHVGEIEKPPPLRIVGFLLQELGIDGSFESLMWQRTAQPGNAPPLDGTRERLGAVVRGREHRTIHAGLRAGHRSPVRTCADRLRRALPPSAALRRAGGHLRAVSAAHILILIEGAVATDRRSDYRSPRQSEIKRA